MMGCGTTTDATAMSSPASQKRQATPLPGTIPSVPSSHRPRVSGPLGDYHPARIGGGVVTKACDGSTNLTSTSDSDGLRCMCPCGRLHVQRGVLTDIRRTFQAPVPGRRFTRAAVKGSQMDDRDGKPPTDPWHLVLCSVYRDRTCTYSLTS